MADNFVANSGSGGETFASDDIGGVQYPISKLAFGALNTGTLVSSGDPFPVVATQSGTWNVGTVTTVTAVTGITNALPAGTNNIGDVDVLSVIPGTGATNLGKAEDAAHTTGDTGVMVLGVRVGSIASQVDANGDYTPFIVDSTGYLLTRDKNSDTVAGYYKTDTSSYTAGGLACMPAGFACDESAPTSVTEGTVGLARMSPNRNIHMIIRDAAANERGANVDASNRLLVHASQSGTWDVGTVTTVTGVTTVTTVTTCSTVTTLTGSGVAHDAADSGNPHKIGAKASTSLSGLTLVANADRTDLFAGVDGVLITRQHQNLEDIVTATPVAITDGSSTSVISAAGAGVKIYVTEVTIANSSASNVTVDLRDGTAGSVKWTFPVPAGGGVVKTFSTPLPFSANTAVAADPSAAASTITVSILGFKSKV